MKKGILSLVGLILIVIVVALSLTNPAWIFGKEENIYMVGFGYDKKEINLIAERLNENKIPYSIVLRVKGELPHEALEATGELDKARAFLLKKGINLSKQDRITFRLGVDLLGMDRRTIMRLFGHKYPINIPQDCIVSEPIFEALKKAYGKNVGDWIKISIYTGRSYLKISCHMVGAFPERSSLPSYTIVMDRKFLENGIQNYVHLSEEFLQLSNFSDEIIVLYVSDVKKLDAIEKLLGCSECLIPLG